MEPDMNVAELIDLLRGQRSDAPVHIYGDDYGNGASIWVDGHVVWETV